MIGNDLIYLYEPPQIVARRDVYGKIPGEQFNAALAVPAPNKDKTRWTLWGCRVKRIDRGGRTRVTADIEHGKWTTLFVVPNTPGLRGLDVEWELIDVYGDMYDIESVAERDGTRRRYWNVMAIRRSPRAGI